MIFLARLLLVFVFVSSFSLIGSDKAQANDPQNPDPQIPIELLQAFAQINNLAKINQQTRFAYGFLHHSSGELKMHIWFDPAKPDGEQLSIIAPTEQSNPEQYANLLSQKQRPDMRSDIEKIQATQNSFELLKTRIGLPVSQAKSKTGNAIYSFPISGEYQLPGGQLKANIAKHLTGQVEVDAVSGFIVRSRIFAAKAFKPNGLVKIKSYSHEFGYEQLWPDGPVLETTMELTLEAKALMKRFTINEKTRRFDFEKR